MATIAVRASEPSLNFFQKLKKEFMEVLGLEKPAPVRAPRDVRSISFDASARLSAFENDGGGEGTGGVATGNGPRRPGKNNMELAMLASFENEGGGNGYGTYNGGGVRR